MDTNIFASQKDFWSFVITFGASPALLSLFLSSIVLIAFIGALNRPFLVRTKASIDSITTHLGHLASWAALLMVLQQVIVVVMQSIFRLPEITFGPFGIGFSATPSWFSEELRLYNAFMIALASAYTLHRGGHVRVDLVFAKLSYRMKRVFDIFGTLFLLYPLMITIYFFSWGYMWKSIASASVNVLKGRYSWRHWSLEASTNPAGFNEIWIYKILIVVFSVLLMIQGLSIILRCIQELQDGEPKSRNNLAKVH